MRLPSDQPQDRQVGTTVELVDYLSKYVALLLQIRRRRNEDIHYLSSCFLSIHLLDSEMITADELTPMVVVEGTGPGALPPCTGSGSSGRVAWGAQGRSRSAPARPRPIRGAGPRRRVAPRRAARPAARQGARLAPRGPPLRATRHEPPRPLGLRRRRRRVCRSHPPRRRRAPLSGGMDALLGRETLEGVVANGARGEFERRALQVRFGCSETGSRQRPRRGSCSPTTSGSTGWAGGSGLRRASPRRSNSRSRRSGARPPTTARSRCTR